MIPNSRQLLTDIRPVPNSHRFSFAHQGDYQRIDDEAAAMTQQQHRFSNRFMPDTKRKSRPKSLPVANDYTPPSSRLKTNALARSFNALIQRLRKKPSTSKKSTAIPLPNPVLHGACTTVPSSLHCHQHAGYSSSSSITSGNSSPTESIFNINNNESSSPPAKSVKRNSMISRCSHITAHSIYSTFPCNDIEEDSEEHDDSPRTSLISTAHLQQQHPSDDLHMQPECILQQQHDGVTTDNQANPGLEESESLDGEDEADSAIDIDSIREVAERLWDDDDTSICSFKERAEWLGTSDRFRAQVLKHYMSHFDFTCQRLDAAFRTLCAKLYFKAEAQQMDRILGAFASRYWECHSNQVHPGPQKTLGSPDVVYAVAYAILLLNTDLHVAHQGMKGRHKMSQSKFVRNTMATLRGLGFPQPCNTTTSISCFSLPVHFISPSSSIQGTSIRASESTVSTLTSSNISCSTSSHISLYRSHSLTGSSSSVCHYPQESSSRRRRWTYTLDPRGTVVSTSNKKQKHYNTRRKSSVTPAQKAWLTEMEALLKDIYISIKTHPIAQMSPAAAAITTTTMSHHHHSSHETINQPSEKNSSARKEGLLTRKHVMESIDKKARQRGWQLCRTVVEEGNLYLYSASPSSLSSSSFTLDDNGRRRQRVRPRTLSTITHTYYRSFRSNSTQINLRHSLTTAMPYASGYRHQRPFVFCVKTADGSVWLFETLTAESAHEWTQLCNYWAARLSKEPLDGAICNLDYGWGTTTSSNDRTSLVHDWNPPPPPSNVSSCLSPNDQLAMLQRRITILEQELDQHRTFKDRIYQRFSGSHYSSSQRKKALDNWECKAQYLIQEVIKMHTYHDTLLHYPTTNTN